MFLSIFILASSFCLTHTAVVTAVRRTSCGIWPDMAVQPGYIWRERCRNCTCVLGEGNVCDGPTCTIPYHPSHEQICARWSTDGCCCEQLGCLKHGRVYNVGESFPRSINRPCVQCPCVAAQMRPSCSVQVCREECVDGVRVDGICCPVCQNGPNCQLPSFLMPGQENHAPIPLNTSTLITDPNNQSRAWNCQCTEKGGFARCHPLDNVIRQPLMALLRALGSSRNGLQPL